MPQTTTLHIRVNARDKQRVAKVFRRIGITTGEAVRLFIEQSIADHGLLFLPHRPNAETRQALQDEMMPGDCDLAKQWADA